MSVGPQPPHPKRAPLHIWIVGLLSLFWNLAGAYVTFQAQTGQLAYADTATADYFNSQPAWLLLVADAGAFSSLAGACALLLERRVAVLLFAVAPCAILVANAYELLSGTSLMLSEPRTVSGAVLAVGIMLAQWFYARAMARRGYLF